MKHDVKGTIFILCFFKGKKTKSSTVSVDHDLAEGLVDLEKLKTTMESTVGRLQLEFRDKISTKILPSALDKIKLESQNGKEKFTLSQVAQIKLNNSMFVVDLSSSPELVSQAAKAIKSWSSNFEPTMDGHVISVPVPRYNIKIILISFFNMVLLSLRHRSAHHALFSTLNV